MPAHWYTGVVTSIHDLSDSVKSFLITIPEVQIFNFLAGQFVTFDLPTGEKRLQRWRSYSIASAPRAKNEIELCMVRTPGGLGTTYFFNEVKIGTELKFKSAEGGFVLPEPIDHDVVMICTGTGIAPFRSMLQDIYLQKRAHKNIHLIFGTRTVRDVLYYDELMQYTYAIEGFRYDIALSRDSSPVVGSHFHAGYVHPIYLKEYASKNEQVHFYICGWSNMIDDAVENLFENLKSNKYLYK